MHATANAIDCVCGASISMIPDIFLDNGVDCILTHRVSDPRQFADALRNADNMEAAIRKTQSYIRMWLTK